MPARTLLVTLLAALVTFSPAAAEELRILGWNVESGGYDATTIAQQLTGFDGYDIVALTEVSAGDFQRFRNAVQEDEGSGYRYVAGVTGRGDRMMIIYNTGRFSLNSYTELFNQEGIPLNTTGWTLRSPLVADLYDKETEQRILVTVNHLARGDETMRRRQAEGLREWASDQSAPIIGIGDYNFDYDIPTGEGNEAFDVFLADGVWEWVEPVPLVDSNWADHNGDGADDYPDSILDFAFLAGAAKSWPAESQIIVRAGDFPDNGMTSDHRPVALTVEVPSP